MNTPFPVLLGNEFENIGGAALVVTRSRAKEIQQEEDRAKSEQNITKVVDDSKKYQMIESPLLLSMLRIMIMRLRKMIVILM